MRIIMAAANFSPAVASRRAKYDDDFGVPAFLDAQPLDGKYQHGSRTQGGKKASARAQTARLPVRAKTRRHTIIPDGTPRLLCKSSPGCSAREALVGAKRQKILRVDYTAITIRESASARRLAVRQRAVPQA
jgi:hypothetical protein